MRRFLLSLCCIAALAACNTTPKAYLLTGEIKNCGSAEALIKTGDDRFDTIRIATDGTFSYSKVLEQPSLSFMMVSNKGFYQLMLINGTNSHLVADLNQPGDYQVTGDLEKEYAFWRGVNRSFIQKSEQDYPSFKELHSTLTAFRDSVAQAIGQVPNATFRELQLKDLDAMMEVTQITYCGRLQEKGLPLYDDLDYKQYMEQVDLNNPDLLSSGLTSYCIEWLGASLQNGQDSATLAMLSIIDQRITQPEIRESMFFNTLYNYYAGEGGPLAETIFNQGIPYLQDSAHVAQMHNIYATFQKLSPGAPAIDCEWEDAQGNKSHLSDLYGKVLYIDVWATWCGPCVAEIPHLEKLVERFKGNSRIEFVSVSVDSRKADWLAKLEKDKPQWKQYLCKNFCEFYNINGIPRFMLLDADGNIITVNAPRPSDEHIDEFLKEHLK